MNVQALLDKLTKMIEEDESIKNLEVIKMHDGEPSHVEGDFPVVYLLDATTHGDDEVYHSLDKLHKEIEKRQYYGDENFTYLKSILL